MFARIPANATVKSTSRGPIPISELSATETLVGYDVKHRALREIVLCGYRRDETQAECYDFLMPAGKSLLCIDNIVLTVDGLVEVQKAPSHFYGFCILNPSRLSVRPFNMLLEAPQPTYYVEWLGDCMLWSEGILIGSS